MRFHFIAITTKDALNCCMLDVDVFVTESEPTANVKLLNLDSQEITLSAPITDAGLWHLKRRVEQKLILTGHARYWPLVHIKINDVFSTGSPADPWE